MTLEEIQAVKDKYKSKKVVLRKNFEESILQAENIDSGKASYKKSRTFVRKSLTKELQDEKELLEMLNPQLTVDHEEELVVIKQTTEDEWDVKIGDPIEWFDPTLSYEITGYRPITRTQGLDFDPKLFTEAADRYRLNGRYTNYVPGTFVHRQYWQEERNRCTNGYLVGKYKLTGLNYFFLNYYRLLSVLVDGTGRQSRSQDFPAFIAKLYEYFHYLELCLVLGKDGLAFKSRGVNKPALH